jgi:hypothetical protein
MHKFITQIEQLSYEIYQQLSGMDEKHFKIALGEKCREKI